VFGRIFSVVAIAALLVAAFVGVRMLQGQVF
jgi:hypothetical protein